MSPFISKVFFVSMFCAAYLLHYFLTDTFHPVVSLYLALFLPILTILFCEKRFTFRKDWQANWHDYKKDLSFVFFNHILLDRLLKYGFALLIAESSFVVLGHLPIIDQLIVLLVFAEFTRYWLHRFLHTNPFLWNLHKVHHSPKKLHASNVVWVHPLDKVLQFFADTFPFMVLGVSPEALSLYFIFYTIHGFFQHSNLPLKLGFFNKIFSGPELHRWHHDVNINNANHNYGNNLIIWDIVFGTYFNLAGKTVDQVGIEENNSKISLQDRFVSWLVHNVLSHIRWKIYTKSCDKPEYVQLKTLRKILAKNKGSSYGQALNLGSIYKAKEFSEKVATSEYADFERYIVEQDRGVNHAITTEDIPYFASTSGTTGKMKLIPVTSSYKQQLRKHQMLAVRSIYKTNPKALRGSIFLMSSPAVEGYSSNGTPYGAISGYMLENLPPFLRKKYLGTDKIFALEDYSLKYLVLALISIVRRDTSLWAAANPSSFLKIIETIKTNSSKISAALRNGNIDEWQVDESIENDVNKYFKSNDFKDATKSLQDFNITNRVDSLWPNLQLIATWTNGSCSVALAKLLSYFSKPPKVIDLGFIASEGRITIPVLNNSGGLPTFKEVFYEFVERNDWENGRQTFRQLHEIEQSKQYYIFLTTSYGLYRYHINDLVEVTGFYQNTPLLRFLQKGAGCTNITGEKLYEAHMIECIKKITQSLVPRFYITLANVDNGQYELYVEGECKQELSSIALLIDRHLQEINIEYQTKRKSGRLKPLKLFELAKGTGEVYKTTLLKSGQREAQFKYQTLINKDDSKLDFSPYVQRAG